MNIGLVVALVVCMVLVDTNGEYPFLQGWGALVLTLAIFGSGLALNAYLMLADKRRRLLALACLALFVLAGLPSFC